MKVFRFIEKLIRTVLPLCVFHHQGHGDRIVLADTNFPSASICGEGAEGPRQVNICILGTPSGKKRLFFYKSYKGGGGSFPFIKIYVADFV